MIIVDTSAWVEFLPDTGSPGCTRVDKLLDTDIATCDPIRMEVLAGARSDAHLNDLRRILSSFVENIERGRRRIASAVLCQMRRRELSFQLLIQSVSDASSS